MYDSINKKVIKVRSKFFERRMEIGGKFKYENTGDISVK
jgi:hypothetical protein